MADPKPMAWLKSDKGMIEAVRERRTNVEEVRSLPRIACARGARDRGTRLRGCCMCGARIPPARPARRRRTGSSWLGLAWA